jgi:hypothetical protein
MTLTAEIVIETDLSANITPAQLRKLENAMIEAIETVLDGELDRLQVEAINIHPVMSGGFELT